MADPHTAKPFAEGQMVTVFRSRRRAGSEEAYRGVSEAMQAAARSVPGFVDFKTFTAEDGEHVSLVTFASLESHQVWRNDGPRSRGVTTSTSSTRFRWGSAPMSHAGVRAAAEVGAVDAAPGPPTGSTNG